MAQAMTTQNQNVQLTKTFFVAFAGMLLAVPIVTLITASIVQAQFGSLVHAAAQAPQSNSLVAGPSCEAPVDDPAVAGTQTNKAGKNLFAKATKWLPFGQSNYSSSTTNTTTNTSTVTIRDNGNTDSRFSGNTFAPTNSQSWSNTQTWNANGNSYNSGNTTNTAITTTTDLSNNSVNTHIHDNGNTTVNDNSNQNNNSSTNTNNTDNSVNGSYNANVEVEIEAELDIL